MTQELRNRWVAALRSGDYKQTTGVLHVVGEGHCCLGVLADIEGLPMKPLSDDPTWLVNGDGSSDHLPIALLPKQMQSKLAQRNDSRKLSFPEIADWIEKNVEVTQ